LDHFVIFGTKHFDYLVSEWVEHYHQERPHQAKENQVLVIPMGVNASCRNRSNAPSSAIECRERLGGLVKHYCRRAA